MNAAGKNGTSRAVKAAGGVRAVTRRRFLTSFAASLGTLGVAKAAEAPIARPPKPLKLSEAVPDVIEQVIPKAGIPTGVAVEGSIQKLIAAGVIDPDKFRGSFKELPAWVERLLLAPSDDPIVFSQETAPYLVNLLWPIGLSNRAAFNENSPINTLSIPTFASTGGWTIGRQESGHVYFNQVEIVRMTADQQAMALKVATTTYRPCCNNSTFFQDCNHGSALLGLLELAASQGASLEKLYGFALTANSYWFPDNYAKTALYFLHFNRKSWRDIEPKLVLSADYSSVSGWQTNVNHRLLRGNVTLPGASKGQQAC
jgi:hypothetical protein